MKMKLSTYPIIYSVSTCNLLSKCKRFEILFKWCACTKKFV